MKSFLSLTLGLICSMASMAQPADGVILEPQNIPLNQEEKADAYSWLSKDGLRLYFTRDNSSDEIWKAERKSLNDEFINPQAVAINGIVGDYDVFSCWLTDDEKTVFFVTHKNAEGFMTTLYKANYDETSKSFNNPIKINLTGGKISETSSVFISGPSLTPDLSQLFVYFNDEHSSECIAYFTTTDGINYSFKSFMNNAENFCPGSLADEGLSYYLTIRDEDNLLVKLTRPNLNSEFANPEYFIIDSTINSDKNYYQPFVNAELGIISLTYGLGTWESNNLAIIKLPTEKIVYEENIVFIPPTIDSTESEAVVYNDELEDVAVDSAAQYINYIWNYEAYDSLLIDSTLLAWTSYCTFGFGEYDAEFIGNDTLSFEPDNDYIASISNNKTIVNTFLGMPNPASNNFRIIYDIKTNSTEHPIFEITNLNGQLVKRLVLESTYGNFEIDINGIADGLYFYKIYTSQFVSENKKLIVKH